MVIGVCFITYKVNMFAQPIYSSRFDIIKMDWQAMLVIIILCGGVLTLGKNNHTIGDWLYRHFYIVYITPVLFVTTLINSSMGLTVSLWISVFFYILVFRLFVPILWLPSFSNNALMGTLIFCSFIATIILVINIPPSYSSLYSFSSETILDLRLASRENTTSLYLGYIYSFVAKIAVPFFIAYSVYKKNLLYIGLSIFLALSIFLIGGHRSVIGAALFCLFIAFFVRHDIKIIYKLALLGIFFVIVLFYIDSNLLAYPKMLIRRMLLLPSYFPMEYQEAFGLMGVFGEKTDTYGLSNAFYVGFLIHGEIGARATAGSMATYIPIFGFFGPTVGILLIAIFLSQFKSSRFNINEKPFIRKVFFPILPTTLWVLLDSNFFTALLSQSLLWLYIFFRLTK